MFSRSSNTVKGPDRLDTCKIRRKTFLSLLQGHCATLSSVALPVPISASSVLAYMSSGLNTTRQRRPQPSNVALRRHRVPYRDHTSSLFLILVPWALCWGGSRPKPAGQRLHECNQRATRTPSLAAATNRLPSLQERERAASRTSHLSRHALWQATGGLDKRVSGAE